MELTEDEARALMTRLIGGGREVSLYQFEFGWGARMVLTDEERRAGQGLGQGNYIVDRTGVVTVHPSLPIDLVMEEYAEERRKGRITGYQVWPPTQGNPNR